MTEDMEAVERVSISVRMLNFLCGADHWDGYLFGDLREDRRGAFWWRVDLQADAQLLSQPTAKAPVGEVDNSDHAAFMSVAQHGLALAAEAATLHARVEALEGALREATETANYIAKWIERGLFDQQIGATNALRTIAHMPSMPWKSGRWDVDHKPYAQAFYEAFPAALSESPKP